MEEELDQDTTSALDGIVGSYDFNKEQLQVFEELVRNMRGAAWGITAATAVTVVLSATKQVLFCSTQAACSGLCRLNSSCLPANRRFSAQAMTGSQIIPYPSCTAHESAHTLLAASLWLGRGLGYLEQLQSIHMELMELKGWQGSQVLLLQILNGDFLPTSNLYFKGMTLASCFRVLDSVVLAILIYLGALAFKRVVASEKNQLAYCVQVRRLLHHSMRGVTAAVQVQKRMYLQQQQLGYTVISLRAGCPGNSISICMLAGNHSAGCCLHADGSHCLLTGW